MAKMAKWSIHLEEQTATNETGICFKFAEISPGVFEGVITNPETIPPDDVDDVILTDLRHEALGEFKRALEKG